MAPWVLVAAAALGAVLWMGVLYAIQRRTGDAGIVDFGWASGLGMAALGYAWAAPGDAAHRVAAAAVAGVWSFRLAFYLLRDRVLRGEEDGRYQQLRAHWGESAGWKFLLFFQAQAILIVLFSLPMLCAALEPGPGLGPLDWLAAALGLGAVAGEHTADRQLQRWRHDPGNQGRSCRAGLWRYSRHPNYFFEWLHWWAYVLFCAGSPRAWAALAGPVLMLVFLYRVTGIPYTEAQALKSRGEDYRDYQETTSAFFPWFPKNKHP